MGPCTIHVRVYLTVVVIWVWLSVSSRKTLTNMQAGRNHSCASSNALMLSHLYSSVFSTPRHKFGHA